MKLDAIDASRQIYKYSLQKAPLQDNKDIQIFVKDGRVTVPPETKLTPKSDSGKADIDRQLRALYDKFPSEMNNLPFWLKVILGGSKDDIMKVAADKDFQSSISDIFTRAHTKAGNENLSVIDLAKNPDTFNELYACLQTYSAKYKCLSDFLKNPAVKLFAKKYVHVDDSKKAS